MSNETKEIVLNRLSNTIGLANENQLDHCKLRLLLAENCKTSSMRSYAIRWMLKVSLYYIFFFYLPPSLICSYFFIY